MAEAFPEYVTDGSHIYLWHPEYESLLATGKLQPSGPPPPRKVMALTPKQKAKLEEARKRALREAEAAVALFKGAGDTLASEDIFGAEPK